MIDRDQPDRGRLTEQDLAIAALVGRYIERREHHETPCVHDLLAAAAEFGDTAVDVLRTVLACYEAMRAYRDNDQRTSRDRPASAGELRSKPGAPGTQPHRR
jgi:hypothetical protein